MPAWWIAKVMMVKCIDVELPSPGFRPLRTFKYCMRLESGHALLCLWSRCEIDQIWARKGFLSWACIMWSVPQENMRDCGCCFITNSVNVLNCIVCTIFADTFSRYHFLAMFASHFWVLFFLSVPYTSLRNIDVTVETAVSLTWCSEDWVSSDCKSKISAFDILRHVFQRVERCAREIWTACASESCFSDR